VADKGKIATFEEIKDPNIWTFWLNSLCGLKEIYFNGGEHLNLPYFARVFNSLRDFNINMFTNLPRKNLLQLMKLQKNNNNVILKCSFHPQQDESLNMFVDRTKKIPKEINWSVVVIKASGISGRMYLDGFRKYGIYAQAEELVFPEHQIKTKTVICDSREHIIGPNLKVYRCLYNLVNDINGISINRYEFKFKEKECYNYPKCFACSSAYAHINY
jgi:hypothetical protein